MKSNNKAPLLFAIYKILFDYSDEEHPLTQEQIIKYLKKIYKIDATRNTIKNNIDVLENVFDLEFTRIHNVGIYLSERLITEPEMKFLSDAIYAYSAINGTYANDLVINLSKIFSTYNRDKYVHNRYGTEKIRKKDYAFLLKLELIDNAIQDKKKISFFTFTYDEHGKPKRTHFGKFKTVVSPYFTVSNMGKHYLIYKDDKYSNLSCTRIEFIEDSIDILEEDQVPLNEVDPTFNIVEFMNTQNYMFSSNIVDAKIKLYNESAIRDAKDWFGDNVLISYDHDKEEVFAKIITDEQGLIYWALQYCDELEIVEPLKTRERMEATLRRSLRNYNTNNKNELVSLNTVLYDSMSSLRYYNNLEKMKPKDIIKGIENRIMDFYNNVYSSSISNNKIILKEVHSSKDITINFSFLDEDPTADIYFNILKTSSINQKESNENHKIVDILITNNKKYFGSSKIKLNDHFKIDYNVDTNPIVFKEETIVFNKPLKSHWNPIIKYSDIKQYRYAIVIY